MAKFKDGWFVEVLALHNVLKLNQLLSNCSWMLLMSEGSSYDKRLLRGKEAKRAWTAFWAVHGCQDPHGERTRDGQHFTHIQRRRRSIRNEPRTQEYAIAEIATNNAP
jgi:hypothetical protein